MIIQKLYKLHLRAFSSLVSIALFLEQVVKKKQMISTRHIVTLENYLNPYYITGFSDAESCFHIVVGKGLKCRTG